MPKTIAGYYQESGRAGRDGLESECLLLFAKKDFARLCNMVRTGGRGRGGRGRQRHVKAGEGRRGVAAAADEGAAHGHPQL